MAGKWGRGRRRAKNTGGVQREESRKTGCNAPVIRAQRERNLCPAGYTTMDTETRRNRRGPQNGGANSRTNQVYRKLCADLMAGVFAPQGRLTEEQLAGR